jgi:hypothetical protein
LQEELEKLLKQTNGDISSLPKPPSSEPMEEILKLIGQFIRSVENVVIGAPDDDGLIQALCGPQEVFKKEIRQTAPDFRPFERPDDVQAMPVLPSPSFLSSEESEPEWQPVDAAQVLFVEDVMKRADS